MLKFKGLRFVGIGRFVDPQEILAESIGRLTQIDGENRNTGGSSGAAKSTVFNALDYLFGLNDIAATVLQSRLTKEHISVKGEFDYDDKPLTITRGKGGLVIDLDGEITTGSKLAEEKLIKIMGMQPDLFRKILHKRQKEGGFFLDFTPKKMYEFLTDCLNMTDLRKKDALVDARLKVLETSKITITGNIEKNRSALSATQESILALGLPPVRDIHQNVILELKTKKDKSASALATLIEDQKTQNALLDSQRPVLEPNPMLEGVVEVPMPLLPMPPLLEDATLDNAVIIQAYNNYILKLNAEIKEEEKIETERIKKVTGAIQAKKLDLSVLSHKISLAATAKAEAVKLAAEIKKIRDAICPTCDQSWVTEAAKTKEAEKLAALTAYKVQIQDGADAEAKSVVLNTEIAELDRHKDDTSGIMNLIRNGALKETNDKLAVERAKAELHKQEVSARNKVKTDHYDKICKEINDTAAKIRSEGLAEVKARNEAKLKEVTDRNKAATDEYAFKTTAVRETQARELEQARGQADVDARAFDAAVSKLQAFEAARVRYDTALASMKQNEVEYNAQLNTNEAKLLEVDAELLKAESVRRELKFYISASFDDALESIGAAATTIIRCIPTMANATIQFEGQKETQEGKIKEEVNAVISMDGEIGIPIKSLSGGEKSAVDLAVDLSVIDFIEDETGKGIDIFILDEPFTGLDTIGIEMALEVLKNQNTNKKLIVVDHNPEVKELVSNRLVVVREGLTSNVTTGEVKNG